MTDVVGPSRATLELDVGLARERVTLARCERRPSAGEIGRGERAKEATVCADRFDQHQILIRALDGVHLHRLEQVVLSVGHDRLVARKSSWKAGERQLRAMNLAV